MRGFRRHGAAALLNGSLQTLEFRGNLGGLRPNPCGLLYALDAILEHCCALVFRLEALVLTLERIELLALLFQRLHTCGFFAPSFRVNARFLRY